MKETIDGRKYNTKMYRKRKTGEFFLHDVAEGRIVPVSDEAARRHAKACMAAGQYDAVFVGGRG